MILDSLFPINFSPSMLADINLCELKFFRKYCQKLVGSGRNPDLEAGSLFAKACEIVRVSYYNEKDSIESSIEKGAEYLLLAPETGHKDKTNRRLAFALEKYFRKFPLDSTLVPVELSDGTFAIEYDFIFDLGIPHPDISEKTICFRGKLDMIAAEYLHGRVVKNYIIDEKTTGSIARIEGTKIPDTEKEANAYRVDTQFIAYAFACQRLGLKIDGAKIRKVPILTNHEDAFELDIEITPHMIQAWSSSTFNRILELIEKYKYVKESGNLPYTGFVPSYSSNCHSYNRLCEYVKGCTSADGEELLSISHQQKMWADEEHTKIVSLAEYKQNLGVL